MERGGRAWRGYFPVGAELTSGQPDLKEGCTSAPSSPMMTRGYRPGFRCTAATCSRGSSRLRPLVLAYMDALTRLGQAVLGAVALSLGLDAG